MSSSPVSCTLLGNMRPLSVASRVIVLSTLAFAAPVTKTDSSTIPIDSSDQWIEGGAQEVASLTSYWPPSHTSFWTDCYRDEQCSGNRDDCIRKECEDKYGTSWGGEYQDCGDWYFKGKCTSRTCAVPNNNPNLCGGGDYPNCPSTQPASQCPTGKALLKLHGNGQSGSYSQNGCSFSYLAKYYCEVPPREKCVMRLDRAQWVPQIRQAGSTESVIVAAASVQGAGDAQTRIDTVANMNGNMKNKFAIKTNGFLIPRGARGTIDTDFDVNVKANLEMANSVEFSAQALAASYSFRVTNLQDVTYYVWTLTLKADSGDCQGITQMQIRPKRPGSKEPYWTLARSGERPQCFAGACSNPQKGCETCVKGGWLPPKQYVEDGHGYAGVKGCLHCGMTWQEKLAKVEEITQTSCKLGLRGGCGIKEQLAHQEKYVCGKPLHGPPPARVELLFKAVVITQTWDCDTKN